MSTFTANQHGCLLVCRISLFKCLQYGGILLLPTCKISYINMQHYYDYQHATSFCQHAVCIKGMQTIKNLCRSQQIYQRNFYTFKNSGTGIMHINRFESVKMFLFHDHLKKSYLKTEWGNKGICNRRSCRTLIALGAQ